MATYHYMDFFTGSRHSVECEVVSMTDKTAVIRLKGFGPKGRRPGTIMRVHLKSLSNIEKCHDTSWRIYCYAD